VLFVFSFGRARKAFLLAKSFFLCIFMRLDKNGYFPVGHDLFT